MVEDKVKQVVIHYHHREAGCGGVTQGSHQSGNSGKILKTFSSQGKTGVFQPKSGKKISNQGTFFSNHF